MLRNRSTMIGAAQGPLTLGGAVPAFPTNFQNVNPQTAVPPIPFGGGGTAAMGVGRASVTYPSRLDIGGNTFGSREMGSRDFSFAPTQQAIIDTPLNQQPVAALPQAPSFAEDTSRTFANIQGTQTAAQQGKIEIKTPRGSMWATPEQAANVMTPRTAKQQSSRSPAEQQALIDQIRKNAPALNQQRTDWVMNTIQQRRENPTTYVTPSGRSVAVPTDRFGEPLKDWMDKLENEGRLNYGPRPAPQTASSTGSRSMPSPVNPSVLASTGFGAMQRAQQESMPQPIGRSPLFAGMGYTAAFGGGPQPARSMMAYNDQEDTRTRFRRTLGLV